MLRPDGSVLTEPGYDRTTQLAYMPTSGLEVPDIPEEPSSEQVEAARELIADAISEFPFVDEASRAAAWAALLTPIMRPAIDGATPLALMDAPAQGTGKGLLVKVVSNIITGRDPGVITAADDEDEWRKRITAMLLEGPAIVLVDNVEKPLRSAHLAAALTASEWTDRVLKASRMVRLPQRSSWYATGNNISVGGDMQRRVYYCRMDARVERPWERDSFKRSDLAAWVRDHRGELVAALLTLARAWFVAGKPVPEGVPQFGSFEAWRHAIGGTLQVAGVRGFLGNQEQVYNVVDAESEGWGRFLRAWHRNYGSEGVSLSTLKEYTAPEVIHALPLQLDRDAPGFGKKLGWALKNKAGRHFNGYWVERAGEDKNGALWRAVTDAPSEQWETAPASHLRLVSGGDACM